nr:uncharacterized protein LOC131278485 [Dasypus novemcinctus]
MNDSDWAASLNKTANATLSVRALPCITLPFLFIDASNQSFDYNITHCVFSNCWNHTKHPYAIIVRIPSLIWVPVNAAEWTGPSELITHLHFSQKRAVGVVVALIAAIIASLAAAATSITSIVQSNSKANTINNLVEKMATPLQTQNLLNNHIHGGLLNVQQQIDLLEEVQMIMQLTRLPCDINYPHICVTLISATDGMANFTTARAMLKQTLVRHCNDFLNLTTQLTHQILTLNSTRATTIDTTLITNILANLQSLFTPSNLITFVIIGSVLLMCILCIRYVLRKVQNLCKDVKTLVLVQQAVVSTLEAEEGTAETVSQAMNIFGLAVLQKMQR